MDNKDIVVNMDFVPVAIPGSKGATEEAPATETETQVHASMWRTLVKWLMKCMTCVLLMICFFFFLGLSLTGVAVVLATVVYICGCVNF